MRGSLHLGPMAVTGICARLRTWGELYPDPSAPAGQNAAARANEDERLARFAGLDVLDRDQVIQLIGWKFQSMAHHKAGRESGETDGQAGAGR